MEQGPLKDDEVEEVGNPMRPPPPPPPRCHRRGALKTLLRTKAI